MEKKSLDVAEYIIALVSEFAQKFGLDDIQAYRYMARFDAVNMVIDNYGIMHTLPFDDAIEGVAAFCQRKGGTLR